MAVDAQEDGRVVPAFVDQALRGSSLHLKPDMASLSTGSVNFPTIVYENSPALILDLATKMREFNVRQPDIMHWRPAFRPPTLLERLRARLGL